jgi:hypothetical protein
MRFRRVLALVTVFSLVAGVAVFITSAGAAAPTLLLSPKSGPGGTAITVGLSAPCKVANFPGVLGALSVSLSAADPVGNDAGYNFVLLNPGQSLSHTVLNVPVGTPAGHYFVRADCEVLTGAGISDVQYTPAPFLVTGGPALPTLTISRTSGPVGTEIDVSGPCAASGGEPSDFAAAIFSPTNPNLGSLAYTQGVGPVQHVKLKVPVNFQAGPYLIAGSCSDYFHSQDFAERSFTVVPSAPAAPAGVHARPGTTTSRTVGPIVVTYATALNHGATISRYTATCTSTNGGVKRVGVHLGSTAAPIAVLNATLKRTYRCVVTATNAKGVSPASLKSEAIVVGAPAKVGRTTATRIASGRVRVSFPNLTAAQMNGAGLTAPRYTARCTSINGGVARAGVGVGTPIVVTALTAGRLYACTVVAHNARGYSVPSAAALVVP